VTASVALIDHGAGNLRSLRAAFERLGASVEVTSDADRVAAASFAVLPGVGAAGPAMRRLRECGIDRALAEVPQLLGVCLGMQLLFERSAEGGVECLGLLAGTTERIEGTARLPHMGWNDVEQAGRGPLAGALPAVCYFAHSYAVRPADPAVVAGVTDLDGQTITAAVASGGIAGVQFHPEKSGPAGRRLLEAWIGAGVAA
jgi:glutamine amidotransferase